MKKKYLYIMSAIGTLFMLTVIIVMTNLIAGKDVINKGGDAAILDEYDYYEKDIKPTLDAVLEKSTASLQKDWALSILENEQNLTTKEKLKKLKTLSDELSIYSGMVSALNEKGFEGENAKDIRFIKKNLKKHLTERQEAIGTTSSMVESDNFAEKKVAKVASKIEDSNETKKKVIKKKESLEKNLKLKYKTK